MKPRTALVIASVAALITGLACGAGSESGTTAGGSKPGDKPSAATVAIGQPLTYSRTIITTKTSATITVSNPRVVKAPNQVQTPERGQFLVVDVVIEVTEGKMLVDGSSFKVVGADSSAYDSELVSVVKPALPFAEIPAGQKTSGSVTFDTAKAAEKGGRVALKDILSDSDVGNWTL